MATPLVSGINVVYLFVRDLERSLRFYRDLLGLPLVAEDEDWAEAALPGGLRFALHQAPANDPPQVPGTVFVDFQVEDVDAAVDQLRSAGVRVEEPWREAYGSFCTVYDPDGYRVELFQPPASS